MPAAAVIPAPEAYTDVVVLKKLVVEAITARSRAVDSDGRPIQRARTTDDDPPLCTLYWVLESRGSQCHLE